MDSNLFTECMGEPWLMCLWYTLAVRGHTYIVMFLCMHIVEAAAARIDVVCFMLNCWCGCC